MFVKVCPKVKKLLMKKQEIIKKVLIFFLFFLCLWIVVFCEKVTKVDMGLSSIELTFENIGGE